MGNDQVELAYGYFCHFRGPVTLVMLELQVQIVSGNAVNTVTKP